MSERLLPSDDPVAEEVLEWTIEKDARDIAQIMHWLEQTNGCLLYTSPSPRDS